MISPARRARTRARTTALRTTLRMAMGVLVAGTLALAPAAHADPPAKPKHGAQKKKDKKEKGDNGGRGGRGGRGDKGSKGKHAAAGAASSATAGPALKRREATPGAAPEVPIAIALDVHRATLENGLRVVVNVDHTAPTVAVAVVYDVGARDEEQGRSGFAHLFEHMMFQGSRNVAKGEHFKLVAGHGGELNGTTNADRTNYFEALPENELALGLWLEADRMRALDVSQENFENQRKVVEEEYRMRVSNVAYAPSRIRREELVYEGYWPYAHATIGSMADLDGAELGWVQAFHASHYGPNAAVLSVAGDVDPDAAIALARTYFEDIPKVAAPALAGPGPVEQKAERRATVADDYARTTGVFLGWAIPAWRTPDHYALELLGDILGGGESSRLHQSLVRERSIAQSVSAGTQRRRGPDLFQVDAVIASGARAADVEKAMEAEIEAIARRGPTDAELARAKRRAQAALVLELQSNLGRARRLGEYELFFGDPKLIAAEPERYLAVTSDDIKRVAATYLGAARRTVVEAEAPGARDDAPKAEHPKVAAVVGDTPKAQAAASSKGAHKGDGKKAKGKKAKKP